MYGKISEIKGVTEKIITTVGTFTLVNQDDIKAVMTDEDNHKTGDIRNNIRQLKHKGFINTREINHLRLLYLTEKGKDKYLKYNSDMALLYEADNPLEEKDSSRAAFQRHSKGRIAFMEGGVNATRFATIEKSQEEPVYIDSYQLKKIMSDSVRGSRITGVCLTPEESFIVYCCERGFTKVQGCETNFKEELMTKLPQSQTRDEMKEIVIGSSIETLPHLLYGRLQVNQQLSNYIAEITDRDKYFVPIEQAGFQIRLLKNKKFRDETVNRKLEESLAPMFNGLTQISNRMFTDYADGKIANLLDLNLGLIKQAKISIMEGKNVTLIILTEYKDFFLKEFGGAANLVDLSREDLEMLMNEAGV